MKKSLCLLLVCCLLFVLMPGQTAFAVTVTASGQLPNVSGNAGAEWTLYSDGTLVVQPGAIDWNHGTLSPWNAHSGDIYEIVFDFNQPVSVGPRLRSLFSELGNVHTITGLEYFNTTNVTSMHGTFGGASSLTELDLSSWDISAVTITHSMFRGTESLVALDLSGWNTSNVTNMAFMFDGAESLECLDLSAWDVSGVLNMDGMFRDARSLRSIGDVSAWDTSSVTNLGRMFRDASSLEHLDLSGWDTSNVTTTYWMFRDAHRLESLDLSGWNTSNVTDMALMFHGATALRELTLGEGFAFLPGAALPNIPINDTYTGDWVNVQDGRYMPSFALMAEPDLLGTWVWQRAFNVTYTVTEPAPASFTPEVPDPASHAVGHAPISVASPLTTTETTHNGAEGTWTFSGWTSASPGVTMENDMFRMPNNDVVFTGTWTFTPKDSGSGNNGDDNGGGTNSGGTIGGGGGRPNPPSDNNPQREAFLIGHLGTIDPRNNITRAEVATIFFRLVQDEVREAYWAQANPFDDVALQQWFNNAISTTTNMGLFTGVASHRFAPEQNITRGELAAVLVRFMDRDQIGTFATSGDRFSDIAEHWARAYINEAAVQGWIQGFPDGTFRPNQAITRAETAAMINRMFQRLIETPDCRLANMITWPDNQNPNSWYFLYMYMATNSYTYRPRADSDTYKELIFIIEPREWWRLERPDSVSGDIFIRSS